MSKIFGGSKSKSENTNNSTITNALQPLLGQATTSNASINSLLSGNTEGFNKFKDATGFDFEMFRGMDQLGSASAGRGVFRSGARDKAVAEFGGNLNNRFAQQYLQTLLGQSGQALGAGQLIAGVGQKSTSSSKPGIGGLLGAAASGAAGLGWSPLASGGGG